MDEENRKRLKWELKLNEQSTTPTQLEVYSEPKWSQLIVAMAQDMRHDLTKPVLRLWREKLKTYADDLICEALVTGCWKVFPSADEVRQQIHQLQEQRQQVTANEDWNRFKTEQQRAEREGLLATEKDYEQIREGMKKLGNSKAVPKASKPAMPQQPLTDVQVRDRKQILRQQTAKLLARKEKA